MAEMLFLKMWSSEMWYVVCILSDCHTCFISQFQVHSITGIFDKVSFYCVSQEKSTFNRLPVVVAWLIDHHPVCFILFDQFCATATNNFQAFFLVPIDFVTFHQRPEGSQIYYDIKQEQRFTKVLKNWTEFRLEVWQSLNN